MIIILIVYNWFIVALLLLFVSSKYFHSETDLHFASYSTVLLTSYTLTKRHMVVSPPSHSPNRYPQMVRLKWNGWFTTVDDKHKNQLTTIITIIIPIYNPDPNPYMSLCLIILTLHRIILIVMMMIDAIHICCPVLHPLPSSLVLRPQSNWLVVQLLVATNHTPTNHVLISHSHSFSLSHHLFSLVSLCCHHVTVQSVSVIRPLL